jgi:hypothetical protein
MADREAMLALLEELTPQKEPIIADRSAVEDYAVCPFRASKKRELAGKADDHSICMEVGNEVHRIAEDCLKEAAISQIPSNDVAEDIVDKLASVKPDIQPQVIKAARYFADMVCELRIHDIIGVELQIDDACKTGLTDMEGRPFKLTTCLDLLLKGQNSLHVIDWKSGYKKRNKEETFNSFQAQFASNILWKTYDGSNGDKIDTIHFWYWETFWGTKSYARFDRDAETASLPHLTLELQIKGRIFEAIKLWATDSKEAWPEEKKCAWCPVEVVKLCPHAIPSVKDLVNDPKGAVDQLVVLKAAYDNAASALKAHVKAHGGIKGSEMVFEWRKSSKFLPKLYKLNNGDED